MLTHATKITALDHRPFGKTGLSVPPIMFSTSALGDAFKSIPEQTKRLVVGQWIEHVAPPVFIDAAGRYGADQALEVLGRALDRLDISPDELIINNQFDWECPSSQGAEPNHELVTRANLQHDLRQSINYDGIVDCWQEGIRLLGGRYVPRLASIHGPDRYLATAKSAVDRDRRFEDLLAAYRALLDLKSAGQLAAVGVGANDWRIVREIDAAVPLDWVMLAGSCTIMNHPAELLAYLATLEQRQIPIVNAGIFHSGYLVGGRHFDSRVANPEDATDLPLFAWRKAFVALCHGHGISPAHACIQFGLSPPGVIAVALDTSQPDRVAENVASVLNKVPGSFWAAMKEERLLAAEYPYLG